jgi:DNA repair protein RecN (Recombination protein N)
LQGYAYNLDDLDSRHLVQVEQRLTAIYQLARKHRVKVDELLALRARFEMELNTLEHSEARLERLQTSLKEALDDYQIRASQLSERRAVAARELDNRISTALAGLGMPGGRFAISLKSLDKITPYGSETVEFNVSANLGQQLQPLSKIASGGEISRISLAIHITAAHATRIPTLIFDEADTGIGGNVAEMIGMQLRKLGENRQVLCITHLPQIATHAHYQLKVEKQISGKDIYIQIKKLTLEERVTEIARMLGGLELTASCLAHAREMLYKAEDPET